MGIELINTPASIMATYIIGEGLMTVPSARATWPLYVASLPDGANVKVNAGVVIGVSGSKDGRLMSSGEVIKHQGIIFRLRSSNYEKGYKKIEAIAFKLDRIDNSSVVVDAQSYELKNVSRDGPVNTLGLEEGTKRRFLFEVGFSATIKNVTV